MIKLSCPNVLPPYQNSSSSPIDVWLHPDVATLAFLLPSFPRQNAVVLTGAAPTEAAVKQQLGRHWKYLHLATHGFFESPARVAAMRAGLKSDEFGLAGAAGSQESASLALTPLLYSAVALAGAGRLTENAARPAHRGSLPDREDGILTAEEVQALDLRSTDLVVLSACETGLGRANGQGVMGLQGAFQGAGARAVLASLWRVDDAATTVLMEQFYANLWSRSSQAGGAATGAARRAERPGVGGQRRADLAKERGIGETAVKLPEGGRVAAPSPEDVRSDPSLWAAFVLSGDGR